MGRVWKVIAFGLVAVGIVTMLPDLKRYVRIRAM
jgi:hypothetical protein